MDVRRALAGGGFVLLAVLLCWRHVLPVRQSDLEVFVRAGSQVLHGHNPYTGLHDPALVKGSAYVYPYLTAWLFAPLALLPSLGYRIAYLVLELLAIWKGTRLLAPSSTVAPLLVLASAVAVRGLQVGSLNALLFLGCALCWHWRDRPTRVGPMLALVASSKLFLVPMVWWLWWSRRRVAAGLAAAGILLVLGIGWLVGPIGPGAYLHMVWLLGRSEGPHSLALPPTWGMCIAGVLLLVAALTARTSEPLAFSCTLVSALALSAIVWWHYVLLALIPVLLVRRALWTWAAALATWLVLPPVTFTFRRVEEPKVWLWTAAVAGLLVWSAGHGRTRLVQLRAQDRGIGSTGDEPPRRLDQPLSPAAQGEPGRLVGVGTRGLRRGRAS